MFIQRISEYIRSPKAVIGGSTVEVFIACWRSTCWLLEGYEGTEEKVELVHQWGFYRGYYYGDSTGGYDGDPP